MRLDKFLYEKGFVKSRSKAVELIKESLVKVDKKVITKPSFDVDEDSLIEILKKDIYVSRAAKKLKGFLDSTKLDVKDKEVLDIGASTGGFTQVLIEYGAKRVYSLDVGIDQLDKSLKDNSKVISIENMDIRDYYPNKRFDIVTCDISFISVRKILKDIDRLSKKYIIILFKPQFEVGKEAKRDKKGVVLDKEAIDRAKKEFENSCKELHWRVLKKEESKIRGKEGNIEYFYLFLKERD